jgi:protein TonB
MAAGAPEMNTHAMHWESWELEAETSKRFRRICSCVFATSLLLAIVVPMLDLGMQEKPVLTPDKIDLAQLLPDEHPVAEHEQQQATQAARQPSAPKSQTVEKAAAVPSPSARTIAQQSGLLQLRDQLAQLRDSTTRTLDAPQTLVTSTNSTQSFASRSELASDALSHSAGATGASGGVSAGASGTGLGTRRTGAVQSAYNGSGSEAGTGGERAAAGRTLQEIQLTFDRSKSAFDAIFTRTAREISGMDAGKVSVSLTIAPDGSVIRCEIVSSSFGNAQFEQKILQRVKTLNFGAKNVPVFTFQNYSLNFLLS